MTNRLLPRASAALTNAAGPPTAEWRRFFESLAAQTDNLSLQAEYMALAARVSSLEDDTGATIGLVLGQQSIKHVGTLTSGNVYLTLQGDAESPGNSYYYGTDAAGVKGWHVLSLDALSDVDLTTVPPTSGDALVFDGTDWVPGAVLSNPMTTIGDIITADTGGTPQRLPVGADGAVLTVQSGEPAWVASASGAAAAGYAALRFKVASGFRATQDFGGTPAVQAATVDRITAQPFTVDRAVTLTALSCENSTASATVGAKFRVGIYDDDSTGANSQPGNLLVETGDLVVSATGVKTGAVSTTLNPGVIYWSAHLSNINVSFRCYPFANFPIQWFGRSTTTVNNPVNHIAYAVGSGWTAMPATWSGGYSSASSNVPAVFLVE